MEMKVCIVLLFTATPLLAYPYIIKALPDDDLTYDEFWDSYNFGLNYEPGNNVYRYTDDMPNGKDKRFKDAFKFKDAEEKRFHNAFHFKDAEEKRFNNAIKFKDAEEKRFNNAFKFKDAEEKRFNNAFKFKDAEEKRFNNAFKFKDA